MDAISAHRGPGQTTGSLTLVGVLVVLLAGCGDVASSDLRRSSPSFGAAPEECGFPPATELTFAGETSLAQVGLRRPLSDRQVRGDLYVTAKPIYLHVDTEPQWPQRWYCSVYPVGALSGAGTIGGPVPDDWQPPR